MILWSIHTLWYKGFAKKWTTSSLKKKPLFWKLVRIKNQFSTKGSTNIWIWHLYNVFRSAKSIQIQPINPILIKLMYKSKNRNWSTIRISRIRLLCFLLLIGNSFNHGIPIATNVAEGLQPFGGQLAESQPVVWAYLNSYSAQEGPPQGSRQGNIIAL